MQELKTTIYCLKEDKQELENKIDSFSRHGRSPNDDDYFEIISLLQNWLQIKSKIECLEEVLCTIISNNTGL